MELEKKVEEKQHSSTDLKCKMKHDETSNVKKQRVELEATIQSLTDGIIKEALLADDQRLFVVNHEVPFFQENKLS